MTFEDVRRLIEPEREALRAQGVTALYVFGSVARGEATPASDVDFLIECDPDSHFNLFDLSGVRIQLSERLGVDVDVIMRNGIHRRIRERVLKEAVRIL